MYRDRLFYIKIKEFTNYQKAYGLDKPKEIHNPEYGDVNLDSFVRQKPSGGLWAFTRYQLGQFISNTSILKDYLIIYPIADGGRCISTTSLIHKYNRSSTKKYIRKVGRSCYDLNYEEIAKDFSYVEIDEPDKYYSLDIDDTYSFDIFANILITNPSYFRVLGFASDDKQAILKKRQNEYDDAIDNLDLSDLMKFYLNKSFGFHASCGNFLSIDDILHDIKTTNGKNLMRKTPNLGKINYQKLLKALVKAGYLDDSYIDHSDKPSCYNIKVSKEQEELLKQFLDEHNISYKKRCEK